MHENEKIKINCPAFLVHGGAEVFSDLSSDKIPPWTPITFELEVMTCANSKNLKNFEIETKKHKVKQIKKLH